MQFEIELHESGRQRPAESNPKESFNMPNSLPDISR
jgi:hypothetical protein